MNVLIEWNGNIYLAKMISDHKVSIFDVDNKSNHCFIELDQCRLCGVWKSEDEELYGDGYCEHCSAMCVVCELYVPHTELMSVDPDICCNCS